MSLSFEIASIISGLSSQKLKERNDAQDSLNLILKDDPNKLPLKTFSPLIDNLTNIIETEKIKYDKVASQDCADSRLNLYENRLNSSSYSLRLFIEKECNRFKSKHVKLLSILLFELMQRPRSKALIMPIAGHLTYALVSLCSCNAFQLNFELHHWITLVENISLTIVHHLDISPNDKNISNLFQALTTLLAIDTIGIEEVGDCVLRTVPKYFWIISKETSNTRTILSLTNLMILKLHLINFQGIISLIYCTIKHLMNLKFISENLFSEIAQFNLLSSELLFNKVPTRIGEEMSKGFVHEEMILTALKDYLVHQLDLFNNSKLTFDDIMFLDSVSPKESTWYKFSDIQLSPYSQSQDVWLQLLSLTRMIDVHYKIQEYQENLFTGGSLLFKRRKVKDAFSNMLKDSLTITDFLCNCLESSSVKIKSTGLQITLFYLSLYSCHEHDLVQLKEVLLKTFQDSRYSLWCCCCLIPLSAQISNHFLIEDEIRMFKMCIPLVKSPESCAISCQLLSNIIKYQKTLIQDKGVLQQISDLYQLSDVNGPSLICDESFTFWKYIHHYGRTFASRENSVHLIYSWLYAHWSQLSNLPGKVATLHLFIHWLSGEREIASKIENLGERPVPELYLEWASISAERSFLTGIRYDNKFTKEIIRDSSNVTNDQVENTRLIYKLFELLDDTSNFRLFLTRTISIVKVIEGLFRQKNYAAYVSRFREIFVLSLSAVDMSETDFLVPLISEVSSLEGCLLSHIIFDELPIDSLMAHYKDRIILELQGDSKGDDFCESSSTLLNNTVFTKNIESVVLFLAQACNSSSNQIIFVDSFLNFVKGLPVDLVIKALPTFFLDLKQFLSHTSVAAIEELTQFLGSSLLAPEYNTSSVSIKLLTNYLEVIATYWVMERTGSILNADCNDIFDWIIARYDDCSFSGIHALDRMASLMVILLTNFNLSDSTISGGKQRIFKIFCGCISRLPKYLINRLIPQLKKYMMRVGTTNQLILLKEFYQRFKIPQQTVEVAAFYCITCVRLSEINEFYMHSSILHMLENTELSYLRYYIKQALNVVSVSNNFTSVRELFHQCRFSILNQWFDQSVKSNIYEPSIWEVDLFDLDFERFCIDYQVELTSFFFAKTSTYPFIMEHLKKVLHTKQETLLAHSIASTIALSFVQGGVKDLIFDLAQDTLGKKFETCFQQMMDDIIYWVLKFLDLSNFNEITILWDKIFKSSQFNNVLHNTASSFLQLGEIISIPFSTGYKILKKHVFPHMNRTSCLHFLIERLTMDLVSSTIKDQKIRSIRQIKLLVLSFELELDSFNNLDLIILELSKLLFDSILSIESVDLLLDLLEYGIHHERNFEKSFPHLFKFLLSDTPEDARIHRLLLEKLDPTCYSSVDMRYKPLWSASHSLLTKTKNKLSNQDFIFILDEKILNNDILMLLSKLFETYSHESFNKDCIRTSQSVVESLIEISTTTNINLSDEFKKWEGQYLGQHFTLNSYITSPQREQDTSYLENPISSIFLEMFEKYKDSHDIKSKFLLEHVVSLLLSDESLNRELPDIKDSVLHYRQIFPPLTVEKFVGFYGEVNFPYDEQFFSGLFCDKGITYKIWLTKFVGQMISMISELFPLFKYLYSLCDQSIELSEIISCCIFKILICKYPKHRIFFILEVFDTIPKLYDNKDANLKIEMIIKLFSHIRTSALEERPPYLSIYERINLEIIIHAMIHSKKGTMALMIFEELYTNNNHDFSLASDQLRSIYSLLNDTDLFYGLPVASTLSSSLLLLNKTRFDSYSSFVFNNGTFNQALRNDQTVGIGQLASVSAANGFTGLALSLSSVSDEETITDDMYSWCLKLNKWDLPTPKSSNTLSKCAFSILKELRDSPSSSKIESQILKVVDIRLNEMSTFPREWIESLSLITSLKMLDRSDWNLLEVMHDVHTFERENIDDSNAEVLTLKHWTRHHFLSSKLKSAHNPQEVFIIQVAKVINLVHQCNCCEIKRKYQNFIDSALALNDVVSSMTAFEDGVEILAFCKRASILQSAKMLWMQKETSASLNLVENLLETRLTGINIIQDRLQVLDQIFMPDVVIDSQLVEWSSFSKHRSPEIIFSDHIEKYERDLSQIFDHAIRGSVCFKYAEFFYKECQKFNNDDTNNLKVKIEDTSNQLKELSTIYKNSKIHDSERKDAKRHFNRLTLQHQHDKERYNNLLSFKTSFVSQALHFLLSTLVHSNSKDDEVMDKFCGLWFAYSNDEIINSKLQKEIGTIPSYKFLPWVNQMTSKLSSSFSPFQDTLQLTLKRMLYKLPYETLYPLISMNFQGDLSSVVDPTTKSRIEIVNKMIAALDMYDNGNYGKEFTHPIQEFCSMSISLGCYKLPPKTKSLELANLNIGKYWLNSLPSIKLPLPTVPIEIRSSQDGRKKERPYIVSVDSKVQISSSGLSLPKISTFTLSNGTKHRVLMKGSNDDLRQDAIMQQVFKQVNKILFTNNETKRKGLRIRTYEVIPLGPRAGLIEFVPNSIPLHDILCRLHANDQLSFDKARKMMKSVQNQSKEERVLVFKKIMDKIKPQLRHMFFRSFVEPDLWYENRMRYTKGVVTTSIVGYLLGLGDRHLNNILVDKKTGEPIHIDLGVAFDQGKLLPIPELVPFRLTRDMVDGLGVTGTEGVFRKNCEKVFKALQDERERVMCVLNVLKWDPLYSWKMTPLKKQKLQAKYVGDFDDDDPEVSSGELRNLDSDENNNDESARALNGVQTKLYGDGLSVEAIVQELISSATDVQNLATIYMGWSPFY